MRRAFVVALTELARRHPEIVLLTGDLGFNMFEPFRDEFPERFINAGVAEQNMVGVASGLARVGFRPYVYSILPFVAHRPLEHIRNDVCYHDLDVTLVACGTGFSYGPAGVTHHGTEDMATLAALPGMTVVSPTHRDEVAGAIEASLHHRGPLYVRLTRGPAPDHERADERAFELGKGSYIRRSERADISVITTSDIVVNVLAAVDRLEAEGTRVSLVAMHTVKPIDADLVIELATTSQLLVTVEEHNLRGGLGAAVAAIVAQQDGHCPFRMVGLPDEFCKATGSEQDMREHYGLDPKGLHRTFRNHLAQD